jgi:hypothetical protein
MNDKIPSRFVVYTRDNSVNLSRRPLEFIFPAMDVLRFVLCHPNGAASFVNTRLHQRVYERCIEALRMDSSVFVYRIPHA